jgi:hypothetical protein
MSDQQTIIDILTRLGNTQRNSSNLTALAKKIKEQQTKTKVAIQACINLISRLANRGNQLEDVVTAANAAEGRETEYIRQLTEILAASPNQEEINDVIQELRTTVGAQIERDPTFGQGLRDDQKDVLGLTSGGGGRLKGGFNWRSKSSKRKKGVKGTIKSSNTRRKLKTKTKSRTRRSKSKSSN